MGKHKDYKVGVYVRLSNEDLRSGESVSIENQKLLLTKHVKEQGWELCEVYQDDGFSGTNQNRPALQRMLSDVKQGFINTVLIKDLSRLGRNYLEVGNLAEVFMPQYGCELISLNEKLDDMMVFRNWFNEQHSKDTSKKVKAVKKMCAESGKFMGTYAPYGYKKDPANKHKLIIDEQTAPNVLKIFELRAQGKGFKAIVNFLNERAITPPRDYFYALDGRENPYITNHYWGLGTLKVISKNECYIGNVVQAKVGTTSYKNRKLIKKPQEEWIRVENMHEPIVSIELWERVRALDDKKYKPRTRSDGTTSMFVGLLYCADCGFKMRNKNDFGKLKNGSDYHYSSYVCRSYATCGKIACTSHSISETPLANIVLEHIRHHAQLVKFNENRIIDTILTLKQQEKTTYQTAYKKDVKSNTDRVKTLEKLIEKLYEDRMGGSIPETVFRNLIQKYEQERLEKINQAEIIETKISSIKKNSDNAQTWTNLIKRYTNLEVLDSDILLLLIDKIIIGETQLVNGVKTCDIKIHYNYVGDIDWLNNDDEVAL